MKRSFIIAGLTSMAVAAGGIVVTSMSQSRVYEPTTAAMRSGTFTQSVQGAHLPGNAVYFVPESTVSWWTSGAETRIRFGNDDFSIEAWSPVMTYVYDRGNDSSKPVYQAIVPDFPKDSGLTEWTKFEAIRGKTGGTPSVDTSYAYNWGGSYYIKESTTYRNVLGYYDDNGAKKNWCSTISAVERLEVLSWAQEWSKPAGVSNYCDSEGNTNTDVRPAHDEVPEIPSLATQWASSKTLFLALGEDVKYYFSTVAAVPDNGDNTSANVPDFAARYDQVFNAYSGSLGLDNWADRTTR